MHILVVTNMWPTPADPSFGIFVAEQVAAVQALGVAVDVCVIEGRASRWNYLRAVGEIRRRLARDKYHLVHAHYVYSGLAAWLAGARRPDRPLVVTHHGVEVFRGLQSHLARWLTRHVDRSLVISRAMAGRLGLGEESVVPCGLDLRLFVPGDRLAACRTLGLDPGVRWIAWVGADRPEKRLALARAAVGKLRTTVPSAQLLVVTGQPHESIPAYLQACDCLLVTSTFEGGPLVVKEALACGRPAVSTDVGDVRQVVGSVPGCALVEAPRTIGGNSPGFAAIECTLTETLAAGLATALAAPPDPSVARRAVSGYGKDEVARRVVAVYRDVMVARGASPGVAGLL